MTHTHQSYFLSQLPVLYGLTTDRQRLVSRMYKSLSDLQRHERMAECKWHGLCQARI
jgi:hypothetical protein